MVFELLSKINWLIYFWTSSSIPLLSISIFMPILHCLITSLCNNFWNREVWVLRLYSSFSSWNKQIFSSEVGLWQSLSVFVLSLFSKKFLFWNTFPIFSYLLSEHWALSLLSSFSISFENSVVTAVVTSLKLIYRLSLAAFKFFVCWGCFSGFFFFCLWCLEFHFDISGCVFMF